MSEAKTKKRNPDLAVSDDVMNEPTDLTQPLAMKEFEELVSSLAPYALDEETPSQTLERLLADRKEFETELLQLKKAAPSQTGKVSFVEALSNVSEKTAEAIFSNFTGTHKQYEEQLRNKTISWKTPISIVAHSLDILMKEPG